VRIIITTLLGTDWLINEQRHKVNNSDPIDVIWTEDQVEGHKRDYIVYQPQPQFPDNRYYDLYDLMKNWVGSDDPSKMVEAGTGEKFNTFPVHKVSVPVDTNLVRANGTVNLNDSVVNELRFELPNKNAILKNDLAVLNIIAANKWRRPIYFTMPFNDLGFGKYLRKDGLAYRLVPVENSDVNTDKMYGLIMDPKKWGYGSANLYNVYYDEENRRHLLDMRRTDVELAFDLIFKNRKDDARKILERDDKMILQGNLPYGMTSRNNDHNKVSLGFLEACYRTDDKALAAKVQASVKKDLQDQLKYYASLDEDKQANLQYENSVAKNLLDVLNELDQKFNPKKSVQRE
jgi:hypothetical protein